MRMTYASFKQFLWKCWLEQDTSHLSLWRKERVQRRRIRKWCHGNISVPVANGNTDAKGSVAWACHARWWGDPGNQVPMCRWQGNEERARNNSDTVQTRASHTTSIRSSRSSRGYTFEAWLFGTDQVRSGSRRSRDGGGSSGTRFVVAHIP